MAHAEIGRDRHGHVSIEVNTRWTERELIGQVPSSRWDPERRLWTVPLSWAACLQLRGLFGDTLTVGNELALWSQREVAERVAPSLALRERITRVDGPGLWPNLYDYQTAGAEWLLATVDGGLLGDDLGLGKTAQILAALEALLTRLSPEDALPALVVCPNSVKSGWRNQAKLWNSTANVHVVEGGAVGRRKILERAREDPLALVVLNTESVRLFSRLAPYGSVRLARCRECSPHGEEKLTAARCEVHVKELNRFDFRTVIVDEAHALKTPESKQTRAVWAIGDSSSVRRRWALTGTPVSNHVGDLWGIMRFVAPHEYPVKSKFVDRYCTPPDAPVWMADGTFKAIGDVNVGDFVVGFSKEPISGQGRHPRFIPSQVTAVNRNVSERLRVTLKSGQQVVCTPNHRWFTGWYRQRSNSPRTMVFSEVAVGKNLRPVIKVPPPLPSELIRDAAWLGGMYDGEGSGLCISQSQVANPDVYAEIERVLKVLEFEYTEMNGYGFRLLGGRNAYAKFFAWCQPIKRRIMSSGQRYEAAHRQYFSSVYGPHAKWDEIVSIESLGEGPVVSLTTETETYVVYGYASHNSLQAWNAHGGLDIVGVNPLTRDEFYSILDPRFRRTPKALVLSQLPQVIRPTRWVQMTAKQEKAYRELERILLTRLEDGSVLVAPDELSKMTRLMQLASSYGEVTTIERPVKVTDECSIDNPERSPYMTVPACERPRHRDGCPNRFKLQVYLKEPSPKLDAALEDIETLGDRQVVVAAQSRQLIEMLARRLDKLKISYGSLTGAVPDYEREVHRRRFVNGDVRLMLMTLDAGGTGVDGLQVADTMLVLQRSWKMISNIQVDGRVDRIGSERHDSVTIIDYVAEDTVEETTLYPRLRDKWERLEEINRDRARLAAAGMTAEQRFELEDRETKVQNAWLGAP